VTDFSGILKILATGGVRFILIGGAAAIAHGAARLTQDVDVVYGREPANLGRLAQALAPYQPYLRGAPPGLPFRLDAQTLQRGSISKPGVCAKRATPGPHVKAP